MESIGIPHVEISKTLDTVRCSLGFPTQRGADFGRSRNVRFICLLHGARRRDQREDYSVHMNAHGQEEHGHRAHKDANEDSSDRG